MTKLRLSEIETFIRFRPTADDLRGYCTELVRALEDVEAELRKPPLSPNNPNDLIGLIRDLRQAAISKEDNDDTVRREALEEAHCTVCGCRGKCIHDDCSGCGGRGAQGEPK